ncbi:putative cation-transporting P-type ATPase [Pseudomonas aeruginosa 39016]|nr:putative cation-transporting P-type ATPase [Pseudomonas aeruginosa 39016]
MQSFQHPLRRAGMGVAGRQGWDAVHGIPAPRSVEQNYRAGLRRNV